MGLPRLNRFHVATVLALAGVGLTVAGSPNPLDTVAAAGTAALAFASQWRKRWRFPAAAGLGVLACEQLLGLADNQGTAWTAAASLCAALGVVALLWPRLDAQHESAPLPPLPGTWALVSTLGASACTALLLFTCDEGLVQNARDVLLIYGFSALVLFAGLMLASHLGPLRWPAQLFFGAVSLLFNAREPIIFDASRSSTVQLAAMAAPVAAFVLGFDWIRAGRTSGARALRAGGLVALLGFVPSLIAAPHQAFSPVALLRLLAYALAFATSAAFAPRVSGQPRDATYFWSVTLPTTGRALPRIGLAAVLPLLVLLPVAAKGSGLQQLMLAGGLALPVVGFLLLIRFRFVRAVLWVLMSLPMIVQGAVHGLSAPIVTGVTVLISGLLGASIVGRHFRRRVRNVLTPYPRLSCGLGAAAAAALTGYVAWHVTPQARGELLAQLGGPVSIRAALLYAPPTPQASPGDAAKGGTVAVDPLGRGTWVVDEEKNEVVLVGTDGAQRAVRVGAWPQQLVVDTDGNAFVSCREAGRVDVIDRRFKVSSIALAGEPRGLALDAGRLYVGLVTARELVAVDVATRSVVARRALETAPYELAVTGDHLAALPRLGGVVTLASLDLSKLREEPLPVTGRQAWHGQALIPAGDDLLVAYAGVDTGMEDAAPADTGGYGGSVRTPVELHVAMLHRGHFIVAPPLVDEALSREGGDITGGVIRGDTLALVSRGNAQLLEIPLGPVLRPRDRVSLGDGVTGLAVDGQRFVSFAAFDRKLVRVSDEVRLTALSPSGFDAELARGRSLFHRADNARVSSAGLACATCHPDGREDGLVWRLKGGRVQTPMLAAKIAETAPYNWHGTSATLEANIAQTVERLGGTGLSDADRYALARYLREGLHAPARAEAHDKPLVALGREVFERPSVGCADCHMPDGTFTDGARHDVGSLSADERAELTRAKTKERTPASFDTPSLIGVGLTAPYFHDGSAPTLEALIAKNDNRMGHTSALSEREKDALVAFLKTL